jgi:hypothetical protein
MKKRRKQKFHLFALSALIMAAFIWQAAYVSAASSDSKKSTSTSSATSSTPKSTDISNGLTQSLNANSDVQIGMAVQRKDGDPSTVIPLSQKNIKNLLGIVIPNGDSPLVLTPDSNKQTQVLVVPSGRPDVLVSNQNGPIKKGDYLSLSSLDGIAMKADETQATAVGRAETNFDGKTNILNTVKLKNSLRQEVNIAIGRMPVEIGVTHNPSFKQSNSDYVPAFIGKIVFQVTSKNVSAARVYIAIVILIGLIVLVANMLYGGVRGGMVAIGRNPLSKKSIIVSLVQTVFFATIIFAGGVGGVYFLLKL